MDVALRFESKCIPEPNTGCVLWFGARDPEGYGQFRIGGRTMLAHRVAWALISGEIPAGFNVLHRCDTPECVNTDHLFLGTQRDNMIDCARKGRMGSWTKPQRQARGERHGNAKLSEGQVRAIRVRCERGESRASVAATFGVSDSTVTDIVRCISWRHLWT